MHHTSLEAIATKGAVSITFASISPCGFGEVFSPIVAVEAAIGQLPVTERRR